MIEAQAEIGTVARVATLLGCALATWAFCGAIMALGPMVMSMEATLIVHAVGGPAGAALFAWLFYRIAGGVAPVTVAASFVGLALALDAGLVAPVFVKSYAMFTSALGLWIPMALIFVSAYLTGRAVHGRG